MQEALVQGEVKNGYPFVYSLPWWIKLGSGHPQDSGLPSTIPLSPTPGIVCDFRLSYGRVLSRSSKIIIVNRNRKEMLINSDMFWKPQEAVQGEPLMHPHVLLLSPLLLASAAAGLSWVLGLDCTLGGTQSARDVFLALRLMGASG